MHIDDETLMAYADGELDAATRAAVESAMHDDPQLARRVARQRAVRARVQAAFAPALAEPVPERLLASARGTGPRADSVIALRRTPRARWSWPQWSALAASLVLGALLGPRLLSPSGPEAPVDTRGGGLRAGGALAHALSDQLASAQPPGAQVQIGVSFRARSGAYCRTFVLRETQPLAGVACRERSSWQVVTLTQSEAERPNASYVPASSVLPPAVARTLDELISGEPLDAAAEAAARARGWSP